MRPKKFDAEEVLFKAVLTFWSQGYKATSMQTLLHEMGIKKQSLYDTFESKHDLFLSALQYYHANVIIPNFAPLLSAPSPKKAIHKYFERRVADIDNPDVISGCLVTNSLTELSDHDEAVRQQTQKTLKFMEDVFYRTVLRGQEMGEISTCVSAESAALLLLNNAQGLFVMSRSGVSPDKLKKIVSEFLKILD